MLKHILLIASYSTLDLNLGGGSSSSNIDSFINGMMGSISSNLHTTTTTTKPYTTTTATRPYTTTTTTTVVKTTNAAQANYAVAPTQAPIIATTHSTTTAPYTLSALKANVAIVATSSEATTKATVTATVYSTSTSATPSLLPLSALTQDPFDIQQMACLVNYQRQLKGAKPLTISSGLNQMALQHSDDQAQMQNMTHTGSNGSTLIDRFDAANYPSQYVAENVAWNQRSVAEVVQAWVNSPGHYANMINPDYTEFGAACVNWYWTFDFGSSAGKGNTIPNCSGYQIP